MRKIDEKIQKKSDREKTYNTNQHIHEERKKDSISSDKKQKHLTSK